MKNITKESLELFNLLVEEIDLDDGIELDSVDGSWFYLTDGSSYMILNKEGQEEHAKDYIEESISYFSPSFLAWHTDIEEIVFEKLVDENEAVLSIVKGTCGVDDFVQDAMHVDGVGHFISNYDGVEIYLDGEYSAFRID